LGCTITCVDIILGMTSTSQTVMLVQNKTRDTSTTNATHTATTVTMRGIMPDAAMITIPTEEMMLLMMTTTTKRIIRNTAKAMTETMIEMTILIEVMMIGIRIMITIPKTGKPKYFFIFCNPVKFCY